MTGTERLKSYIARAIESAGSSFQRLTFIGSLRDAYTGRYLHEGWSGVTSAEEVHEELRQIHGLLFAAVLNLSIIDLSKELRDHFQQLSQPELETSRLWLEVEPFRDLIPQGYSPAFRELFVSDIRTALEVLCLAPEWSELASSVASPRSLLDQSLLPHWLD